MSVWSNKQKKSCWLEELAKEFDNTISKIEPYPYSSQYYSSNGAKLLVVYANQFSDQPPPRRSVKEQLRLSHILKAQGEGTSIHNNEVPPSTIQQRHLLKDSLDKQTAYYHHHHGLNGDEDVQGEPKGVLHIADCWTALSHPDGPIIPTRRAYHNVGGTQGPMAIQHWYKVTLESGNLLSSVFKQEWPDKWEEAMKYFKAGKWQAANPGPWVGKAIVYKLTSSIRPDKEDAEEYHIVTVPVGHFVGGHILFLDIHA
ncbi:hypothetical protein F5876DRAFT_82921 [Lentinula aff. lateritia]|uniref:Uncharacterized protein n=1 Tax=Lentinula aff. lateritia TaxID=2804960 RepID=A0ACC1TJA8_9AGAR|nr:hypothetical protein F5876DRAFT_82921 [Lentinula aff. lateritia]